MRVFAGCFGCARCAGPQSMVRFAALSSTLRLSSGKGAFRRSLELGRVLLSNAKRTAARNANGPSRAGVLFEKGDMRVFAGCFGCARCAGPRSMVRFAALSSTLRLSSGKGAFRRSLELGRVLLSNAKRTAARNANGPSRAGVLFEKGDMRVFAGCFGCARCAGPRSMVRFAALSSTLRLSSGKGAFRRSLELGRVLLSNAKRTAARNANGPSRAGVLFEKGDMRVFAGCFGCARCAGPRSMVRFAALSSTLQVLSGTARCVRQHLRSYNDVCCAHRLAQCHATVPYRQ